MTKELGQPLFMILQVLPSSTQFIVTYMDRKAMHPILQDSVIIFATDATLFLKMELTFGA
jgi:hypothetical protein